MVFRGIRLAALGIFIGIASASALTRLIASLLFRVKPWDPAVFASVPIILIATALLAVWFPPVAQPESILRKRLDTSERRRVNARSYAVARALDQSACRCLPRVLACVQGLSRQPIRGRRKSVLFQRLCSGNRYRRGQASSPLTSIRIVSALAHNVPDTLNWSAFQK